MKRFGSLIIIVILYSCGSSSTSIYTSDYLLSNDKAYSKTSNIYVSLPQDWFTAEDNECKCTELWIVKNDYTASISFRKINIEPSILGEFGESEPEKVADYSKIFTRAKLGKNFDKFSGEETFLISGKKAAAYQYVNDKDQRVRVVIFKHFDKFYESEAISNGYKDLNELFRIQNSILSTLN